MRLCRNRWVACAAIWFICFCVYGLPRSAKGAGNGDRVPVLLVHGLVSGVNTWNQGKADGMWSSLLKSGYQPETSLFTLDYSQMPDPDYARLFKSILVSKIDEIKAKTGASSIDVVAHGYGGLLARFYVQSPDYREDIRNLIMIAPPNHGSIAVQNLKTSLLLLSHAVGLLNPKPAPSSFLDMPPFLGESEYVTERAPAYRVKYADYVMAERMLWVPSPKNLRPRDFEVWFKETFPDEYDATLGDHRPPLASPPSATNGGYDGPPALGQDISRSYYEYVAMIAGKNEYLSEQARQKALSEMLTRTFSATSWKDAAARAGKALLLYFAGRLMEPGKALVERRLLETALAKVKLKPDSVVLGRLLEETIPGQADPRLSVNHFLNLWNTAENTKRLHRPSKPRYVTIAGETFNPWKLVLPQVAPNDLAVEVDSAILDPGLDDAIHVLRTGLSSGHVWLQNNERTVKLVIDLLREPFPPVEKLRPAFKHSFWKRSTWEQKGQFSVSNYVPQYVSVDLSQIEGIAKLSVTPSSADMLVWAYGKDAQGCYSAISLEKEEQSHQAVVDGSQFGTVIVGFRLNAPMKSEVRRACEYRICISHTGDLETPPKVNVVNRSKSTTSVPIAVPTKGAEAASKTPMPVAAGDEAGKWVWDFGDGSEKLSLPGQKDIALEQVHRFPKPGKYTVTASYVDAHGSVLERQSWQVSPQGEDSLEVQFCTTPMSPPQIHVTIVGPQKWVTGRPAQFTVEVKCELPEGAMSETVAIDPGRQFQVQWTKPGTFQVKATAIVRVTYSTPEGTVTSLYNALSTREIEVLSLGITQ